MVVRRLLGEVRHRLHIGNCLSLEERYVTLGTGWERAVAAEVFVLLYAASSLLQSVKLLFFWLSPTSSVNGRTMFTKFGMR